MACSMLREHYRFPGRTHPTFEIQALEGQRASEWRFMARPGRSSVLQ
jgi:hypothetical protein